MVQKMLKRILFVVLLALAAPAAYADAAAVQDRVVRELHGDGYNEIRMSRTLLGRLRFVATRPDSRREIVVNPVTGVILRDYIRFFGDDDGKSSGGGSFFGGNDGDDDDDDDYDDDYDDDDDGDDNSGSGSSGSGSGSDDDDDESDNSGSGSSNSGSGSDDD